MLFLDRESSGQSSYIKENRPEYLMVLMNGHADSKKQPIKVSLSSSTLSVEEFIREDVIKKHMKAAKTYPSAKLYSKNGVELTNNDIIYMKAGDTVYLARHGEPFDYQQVMQRYEKISVLGAGGFGKVYLMKDREKSDEANQLLYAVKFISMNDYLQKADGIYEIEREAKTLKMLNSKYIIQLENYFMLNKDMVLVMEYAQGGEIKQYLQQKGGRLPEHEVQSIMKQIVSGLHSCHQKGIIHRDLKLENVLFMDKEHTWIKIVDFGIAGFCLNHLKDKTDAGTFKYMAPEVLKGEISLANPQMDIWGLGIMMFLMLFGYHPFLTKKERFSRDYELKPLIQRIIHEPLEIPNCTFSWFQQRDRDDIEEEKSSFISQPSQQQVLQDTVPPITEEARTLLSQLLCKNPKERIQLSDVLYHAWFDLNKEDIELRHKDIEEQVIAEQQLKEEKKTKKFLAGLQKRSTLAIAGSNSLLKPPQLNTKLSSLGGSFNQRGNNAHTPVAIKKQLSQLDVDKDDKRGKVKREQINPFDLEDKQPPRRGKAVSPMNKPHKEVLLKK